MAKPKSKPAPEPVRRWPVEQRSLEDLRSAFADYNPRTISDDAAAGLRASLQRFGLADLPVLNRTTGNLVSGHQRVKQAIESGASGDVDVIVVELAEIEEKALNVTLNNPHIAGEFTSDLDGILEGLRAHDEAALGELRLDELLADMAPPSIDDEEPTQAPQEGPPVTARGETWVLGAHRLRCGDCRDPADVMALFGSDVANLAVTSPPYASQREYDPGSEFEPIAIDDFGDWFDLVQSLVADSLAADGSWLLNIKPSTVDWQRSLYVADLVARHV